MRLEDEIVEQFRGAAVGMVAWATALDTLGRATRARASQLAALDPQHNMILNVLANVCDEEVAVYYASGGPDPARNPRTHALVHGPAMRCLTEADFTTPEIVANSAIYRGMFARYDLPHACLLRLTARDDAMTALALLRPASAGPADAHERRLVEAVAPGLSGAIRTGLHVGTMMDGAVLDTAERLSGPAILLGLGMTILSLSPTAEALLRGGTHLSMRGGRLVATGRAGTLALDRAFADVTAPGAGARQNVPLMLPGHDRRDPLIAELSPLPARPAGPLSLACAMLVIRMPRPAAVSDTALAAALGLTPAETQVARLLADGLEIATIADRRGSAVSTVRNQVKSLFDKTGCRRQAELVLKIRQY